MNLRGGTTGQNPQGRQIPAVVHRMQLSLLDDTVKAMVALAIVVGYGMWLGMRDLVDYLAQRRYAAAVEHARRDYMKLLMADRGRLRRPAEMYVPAMQRASYRVPR